MQHYFMKIVGELITLNLGCNGRNAAVDEAESAAFAVEALQTVLLNKIIERHHQEVLALRESQVVNEKIIEQMAHQYLATRLLPVKTHRGAVAQTTRGAGKPPGPQMSPATSGLWPARTGTRPGCNGLRGVPPDLVAIFRECHTCKKRGLSKPVSNLLVAHMLWQWT